MKTILCLYSCLFLHIEKVFAGNTPPITESEVFHPTAEGLKAVIKGDRARGFEIDALMKIRVTAPSGIPVRVPVASVVKIEVTKDGKLVGESLVRGLASTSENRGTYFYFAPTGKGKFLTFGGCFRLGVLAAGVYEAKVSEFHYQVGGTLYTYKPTEPFYKKTFEIVAN